MAQLYIDRGTPEKVQSIAERFSERLSVFSKPRLAKITKGLVDFIAKTPGSQQLQIKLCIWMV